MKSSSLNKNSVKPLSYLRYFVNEKGEIYPFISIVSAFNYTWKFWKNRDKFKTKKKKPSRYMITVATRWVRYCVSGHQSYWSIYFILRSHQVTQYFLYLCQFTAPLHVSVPVPVGLSHHGMRTNEEREVIILTWLR